MSCGFLAARIVTSFLCLWQWPSHAHTPSTHRWCLCAGSATLAKLFACLEQSKVITGDAMVTPGKVRLRPNCCTVLRNSFYSVHDIVRLRL